MDAASSGVAMVQTASASEADQPPVPGATAVRVLGALLILLGGHGLYALTNAVVQFDQRWIDQRWIDPSVLFATFFLSGVLGLLIIVAGVLLVRLDRAGRLFGGLLVRPCGSGRRPQRNVSRL